MKSTLALIALLSTGALATPLPDEDVLPALSTRNQDTAALFTRGTCGTLAARTIELVARKGSSSKKGGGGGSAGEWTEVILISLVGAGVTGVFSWLSTWAICSSIRDRVQTLRESDDVELGTHVPTKRSSIMKRDLSKRDLSKRDLSKRGLSCKSLGILVGAAVGLATFFGLLYVQAHYWLKKWRRGGFLEDAEPQVHKLVRSKAAGASVEISGDEIKIKNFAPDGVKGQMILTADQDNGVIQALLITDLKGLNVFFTMKPGVPKDDSSKEMSADQIVSASTKIYDSAVSMAGTSLPISALELESQSMMTKITSDVFDLSIGITPTTASTLNSLAAKKLRTVEYTEQCST